MVRKSRSSLTQLGNDAVNQHFVPLDEFDKVINLFLVKLIDVLYYHFIELLLDLIILDRILVLHGLAEQIREYHENLIELVMHLEVIVQLVHLTALEILHDA